MAFAAVDPIDAVSGSLLTMDFGSGAEAIDGIIQFSLTFEIPTISPRAQFGTAAGGWLDMAASRTGKSLSGSFNGYVSSAVWTKLRTRAGLGTAIACTAQDETGAGKEVMSGNFIITGLTKTNAAEGFVEFSGNIKSAGTITFNPDLVLTPAAGTALAAQVGVSATVATFACTGGSAAYAYTCTGLGASALTLNSSSGVLNGTPAASMQGVYNVIVTATDANGVAITRTYVLTIAAA